MDRDNDITEIVPIVAGLLAQGANVFLKMTCTCCGQRITGRELGFVAIWGTRAGSTDAEARQSA